MPEISAGVREHPITKRHFRLEQIQPDRDTKEHIEQLISSAGQNLKAAVENTLLKRLETTFVVAPAEKVSVVSAPTQRFFPPEQKAPVLRDNPVANKGSCCNLM